MPDDREPTRVDYLRLIPSPAELDAIDERQRREATLERQAEERYHRNRRLIESNACVTEEDHRRIVRATLSPTQPLSQVRPWSTTGQAFLVLLGPTGRGKTVSAGWWHANHGGIAVTARELCIAHAQEHAEARKLRALVASERLVTIDELGHERDADEAESGIFETVNMRLKRGFKTLLLGNIARVPKKATADAPATAPRTDFATRYGERTWKRIRAQGHIYVVTGPCLREAIEERR